MAAREIPSPSTSAELVAEGMRVQIVRGQLPAGSAILQSETAAAFGVSITPVREAIRHLASLGLVMVTPHRGATVSELSVNDAVEVQRLRLVLEPELARRAARHATDDQVRGLLGIASALAEALPHKVVDLEEDFANALFVAAQSPRMMLTARSVRDRAAVGPRETPSLARGNAVTAQHPLLVAAIAAHEEHRAGAIVERHLAAVVAALEEHARSWDHAAARPLAS